MNREKIMYRGKGCGATANKESWTCDQAKDCRPNREFYSPKEGFVKVAIIVSLGSMGVLTSV
jgi:hypothetical protein